MRKLPLVDNDGHLKPAAISVVWGAMFYPEDPDSRDQYSELWQSEYRRRMNLDVTNRWSKFSTSALQLGSKKRFQVAVAGLATVVLIRLVELQAKKITRYQAARIASEILKKKTQHFGGAILISDNKSRTNARGETIGVRKAPTSPEDIEKHWRAFKSVVHLSAAEILLENSRAEDIESEEYARDLLGVAAAIETFLQEKFPEHFDNFWHVDTQFALGWEDGCSLMAQGFQNLIDPYVRRRKLL